MSMSWPTSKYSRCCCPGPDWTMARGSLLPETDALGSEKTPTPANPNSTFGWIGTYWHLPDTFILNHHSLEAYLFIRFHKVLVAICVVGCCLTWPVLFPINVTGNGGAQQLDMLTFGNVDDSARYFAHAAMAWVFLGFVMFVIARELVYLAKLRKAYYGSPWQASRMSTRTVLFTSVPAEYRSETAVATLFPEARNIWVPRDTKTLEGLLEDAEKAALRQEKDIIKWCGDATAARHDHGKGGRASSQPKVADDKFKSIQDSFTPLRRRIREEQANHLAGKVGEPVGAVFVEFASQLAAEEAAAQVAHHEPAHMRPRQVGIRPDEVLWKNIGMSSRSASLRHLVCIALICVMILFWGVPVAFVGILSNVNRLTENVPFLSFLNDIPDEVLGAVTGLLPVVLLAILLALVPKLCRLIARQSGAATLPQVELRTQNWYFAFLVIQVFLVTTLSSSATAVASDIVSDPPSAANILARNLPKASNFYLAYFVLQGIGLSALHLLNPGVLWKKGVLGTKRLAKTPRKMFDRLALLKSRQPGSEYPKYANLGVIAIVYSCIAPLVLGFAAVGFALLYLAHRYNFLYAYGPVVDTRGAAYARGLKHLIVGLYLAELCLIGLFGVGSANSTISAGPLAMTVVLLIATIIYHVVLLKRIRRMAGSLPGDRHHDASPLGRDDVEQAKGPNGRARAQRPRWKRWLAGPQPEEQLHPRFQHAIPADYYPPLAQKAAFLHPAVSDEGPVLWIVRDEAGVSQQELRALQGMVPVSDAGAAFDERGKVDWRLGSLRDAPLWKDPVLW
jgi:calcium permeable stress-gated cation channel